jgi:hypothetical protein
MYAMYAVGTTPLVKGALNPGGDLRLSTLPRRKMLVELAAAPHSPSATV